METGVVLGYILGVYHLKSETNKQRIRSNSMAIMAIWIVVVGGVGVRQLVSGKYKYCTS